MIRLSICFAVYNQSEMLAANLRELVTCTRDDVEFVVCDDCSTEDIAGLVSAFDDPRIRYVRNEHNLGHDLNILHALDECRGTHILLLRTRDMACVNALDDVMNVLDENPNAGYFLFSAEDERGNLRMNLPDRTYAAGLDAAKANGTLLIHPSGSIYARRFFRTELYRTYIRAYFDTHYGFVAHQLIRDDLVQNADFVTSHVRGWKYANTLSAEDVAVNSTRTGTNVYAPEYSYPRYACEFDFVRNELEGEVRTSVLCSVVRRYYEQFLLHLPSILRDERYATHYNSRTQSIDTHVEALKLDALTRHLMEGLPEQDCASIRAVASAQTLRSHTIYPVMRAMRDAIVACRPAYGLARKALALVGRS